jgi:hypothetical protein
MPCAVPTRWHGPGSEQTPEFEARVPGQEIPAV